MIGNRYGSIITDDKKTSGYYVLKWHRTHHGFQEDIDVFQSGDVVFNATYLNPIQLASRWYTLITIKTGVCVIMSLYLILTWKNLLIL